MKIIDFHTHVYPIPELPDALEVLRHRARELLSPLARFRHDLQIHAHDLPHVLRDAVDEVGAVAMLPNLLIESSPRDHLEAMDKNGVERAVIVAFPPTISSNFILKTAAENPSRHVPAVALSTTETAIEGRLEEYAARGARILKIHPLADALDVDADSYRRQIEFAEKKKFLVIVHAGVIKSHFFKKPETGAISRFQSWFADHPHLTFLLAHMGYHDASQAISVAKECPNVSLLCSWQPVPVIAEAVQTLGAERCLYASDWPLLGENMTIALERLRECESRGLINQEQLALILGGNAERILGLVHL